MGDESGKIRCKVAFWYYRRMALIAVLLTAGGLWFMYDGKVGWPKKNVVALAKEAFDAGKRDISWGDFTQSSEKFTDAAISDDEALELIEEAHGEGAKPMPWEEFVISPSGKDALAKADEGQLKAAFAAGGGEDASWGKYANENSLPLDKAAAEADEKTGIDGFVALKGAFDSASRSREWSTYGANTGRKGWGAKEPKYHSSSEISGQYAFAYALFGIAAAMVVWTLINSRRQLSGDADSITSETGTRVPFDAVFRVDKRKWDNKGLAYVHYKDEGGSDKRLVRETAGSQ